MAYSGNIGNGQRLMPGLLEPYPFVRSRTNLIHAPAQIAKYPISQRAVLAKTEIVPNCWLKPHGPTEFTPVITSGLLSGELPRVRFQQAFS
jgi:hypothetical protein